jgi:hypothetical protein
VIVLPDREAEVPFECIDSDAARSRLQSSLACSCWAVRIAAIACRSCVTPPTDLPLEQQFARDGFADVVKLSFPGTRRQLGRSAASFSTSYKSASFSGRRCSDGRTHQRTIGESRVASCCPQTIKYNLAKMIKISLLPHWTTDLDGRLLMHSRFGREIAPPRGSEDHKVLT